MSLGRADPWQVISVGTDSDSVGQAEQSGSFEDNFNPKREIGSDSHRELGTHERLPDSNDYLKLLERKLARVQRGNKLLDSLRDKRNDCMRGLLAAEESAPVSIFEQFLELDTPIESGRLHRHLLPIQAVNVGETVHIVEHDELQQKAEQAEVQEQAAQADQVQGEEQN